MPNAEASSLRIRKGSVAAMFAYDVGSAIDLDACRRRITDATEAARIEHRQPAPAYLQFEPPPLRVVQRVEPIPVGGRLTSPTVEVTLYDFGAMSVRYEIPVQGAPADLLPLALALEREPALRDDSRRRIDQLGALVGDAVQDAHIAPQVEDYVLYRLEEVEGIASVDEWSRHAADVARILTPEEDPLAREEIEDVMAHRVSYGPGDLTLVDWNGALVVGTDMEDVCEVLEFANVQLLEMRYLDGRLDRALDAAYDLLTSGRRAWRLTARGLARVARLQVDGAILFERVSNALKLVGDQFLARVYRLAAGRLRLGEWNASILRKLETLESIYRKMGDRAASRRMELLEWLIIVLIALSIALSLLTGKPS